MIRKIKLGVKKISGAITVVSVEIIVVFIAFFVSIALLIVLIRQIFFKKNDDLDHKVFDFLLPYVSDMHTSIMQAFTFLGSQKFLVPAWLILLTISFFVSKNKWNVIKLAIIGISNLVLMFGLKFFFNRHRPLIPLLKEVPGLSFPSGHAYMSLTFFAVIIYIVYHNVVNKWLKWSLITVLIITILMIGLSRVYLRVHYSSDIIAGYCFGILSLVILMWMLRRIEKFNARKIPANLNVTKPDDAPPLKSS